MVPWQGDRNKGKTVHIQQIRGYVARTGLIATDRLVKKAFTRVREIFLSLSKSWRMTGLRRK